MNSALRRRSESERVIPKHLVDPSIPALLACPPARQSICRSTGRASALSVRREANLQQRHNRLDNLAESGTNEHSCERVRAGSNCVYPSTSTRFATVAITQLSERKLRPRPATATLQRSPPFRPQREGEGILSFFVCIQTLPARVVLRPAALFPARGKVKRPTEEDRSLHSLRSHANDCMHLYSLLSGTTGTSHSEIASEAPLPATASTLRTRARVTPRSPSSTATAR